MNVEKKSQGGPHVQLLIMSRRSLKQYKTSLKPVNKDDFDELTSDV